MTQEQMIDGLFAIGRFFVRALAIIGFFAIVAFLSYTSKPVAKQTRDGRCINSACEDLKCSPRFTRHMGDCKK